MPPVIAVLDKAGACPLELPRRVVLALVRILYTDRRCRSSTKGHRRPTLGNPEREDLTLELWIEIIKELRDG